MASRDVFDFHSQSVSFVPDDAQARHLVDHQIRSGVCWGRQYREASWKAFRADHGTGEERWYLAIVSELRDRVVGAALAGIP